MWPHGGAAHFENVLIMDMLTNWPPLVNFSTGSCVCLRASHLVLLLIQPTSAGSQDAALRDIKDSSTATGETCHTQMPIWLCLLFFFVFFNFNSVNGIHSLRIFIVKLKYDSFLLRHLRSLKNGGWIFSNAEKEKGGELSTFCIYFVLCRLKL